MDRSSINRAASALLLIVSATFADLVYAYSGDAHQQLMFLAARQYNECVKETPERRLSALQVRYAAKAAVQQAEASFLRRMFRWGFYERDQQSPKSTLWVVETRMHEHFNALLEQSAAAASDADQFSIAGRIAAYVQDVSSPVRVVPIYTARFWRFNTNDRFDNFHLADASIEAALQGVCGRVLGDAGDAGAPDAGAMDDTAVADYTDILKATAEQTLQAIVEPIPGMPATWQAFWRLASNPTEFGEYGPAGNRFGQSASFRCGEQRCVLLNEDPLYQEFASERHAEAVIGTMRVLHALQTQRLGVTPVADSELVSLAEDMPSANAGRVPGTLEDQPSENAEGAMARAQARSFTTANE